MRSIKTALADPWSGGAINVPHDDAPINWTNVHGQMYHCMAKEALAK
jgi:hypothetical protein